MFPSQTARQMLKEEKQHFNFILWVWREEMRNQIRKVNKRREICKEIWGAGESEERELL